jgi:hypothetical protein
MAKAKSGGGITSRNNRNVGVRTGTPRRKVNPGGASQIGMSIGDHITDRRTGSKYKGEQLYGGFGYNTNIPLGNQAATNVGKGGPGKGYNLYGQCGSQSQYGKANPGIPQAKGFQPKDMISAFGPDSAIVKTRK